MLVPLHDKKPSVHSKGTTITNVTNFPWKGGKTAHCLSSRYCKFCYLHQNKGEKEFHARKAALLCALSWLLSFWQSILITPFLSLTLVWVIAAPSVWCYDFSDCLGIELMRLRLRCYRRDWDIFTATSNAPHLVFSICLSTLTNKHNVWTFIAYKLMSVISCVIALIGFKCLNLEFSFVTSPEGSRRKL